jgi:hypothetical protein
VDSSSISASAPKKLHSSGVPISGSLPLSEHVIVLLCFSFGIPSLPEFFVCLVGSLVSLVEGEEEETPLVW